MSEVGKGELFVHILLPIFAFTSVSKYECMTDSPLLTPPYMRYFLAIK